MIGAEQKMKLQGRVSSIWAFEEEKGEGRIYVANITVATCSPQGCVCSHHHQLNNHHHHRHHHHHHHHHHHCQPKIEKRVIWSKTLKRQRTVCEQRQRKRSKQSWKREGGTLPKKNKWKAYPFLSLWTGKGLTLILFSDYLNSQWKSKSLPCPVFISLFMHQVLKCKRLLTYWKNLH